MPQEEPRSDKLDDKPAKKQKPLDPQLQAVITAWPEVPKSIKAAILVLIGQGGEHEQ